MNSSQAPGALGFDPEKRLRERREFLRFFENPEVFRLGECTVFRIPNNRGHFRLGITLKAKGRSHQRNAVKRRIREAFRVMGPSLGAYDYNVVISHHRKLDFPFPSKLYVCLTQKMKSEREARAGLTRMRPPVTPSSSKEECFGRVSMG